MYMKNALHHQKAGSESKVYAVRRRWCKKKPWPPSASEFSQLIMETSVPSVKPSPILPFKIPQGLDKDMKKTIVMIVMLLVALKKTKKMEYNAENVPASHG